MQEFLANAEALTAFALNRATVVTNLVTQVITTAPLEVLSTIMPL